MPRLKGKISKNIYIYTRYKLVNNKRIGNSRELSLKMLWLQVSKKYI